MKEKWKVIEKLLSDEYHIEVRGSYEGWGAGYDTRFLPLTEMWAKGEVQEVPEPVKRPVGVVFSIQDLSQTSEEDAINTIRHQIEYLFSTELYLWRLGQREFYKFGFTPTSFVVLYSVLESMKTDQRIIDSHPSAQASLQKNYQQILRMVDTYYPHHLFSLSLLKGWLGSGNLQRDVEKLLYEYLNAKNSEAYDILMEDLLGKYMAYIEKAQEMNYIDLLLDEARGKVRKDAHKGRIMTDLLKKLPDHLQKLLMEYKDKRSVDIPEVERRDILKSLKNMPDWMKDYLKQMSYLDMIERDVKFLMHFLPKTLEVDIEHRGFLSFLIKGWEEQTASSTGSMQLRKSSGEHSKEDKLYERAYGLNKEEFRVYQRLLSNVKPYIDALKRKLRGLMPEEEELWSGKHFYGRRLNTKAISVEASIGRGRFYLRREEKTKKELAFKLIIDVSTSMKKEDKIKKAIEALLLFSEVISSLKMPFSIDVFSDRVFRLKDFQEDYGSIKWRIVELFNLLGGGTNLEKVMLFSFEDLQLYCIKNHVRGCMIVFSDGEPTKGLRGQELKGLINRIKATTPVVGIGVGKEKNYVDYYFETTGIKIKDVSDLPLVFTRIIENQAKRLLAFQ
ncbi:MAG: VWA domain-containing protein [Aquificaceae bacterium]|nr:VWA domain-containing protein [Aquificaceae bacterium]MDW8422874.1 VWA domain-containing protein [Aquificaceae bacterium]